MLTLLVAEDEYLIRKGIVSLIAYEKYHISTVLEAENGQVALELFKAHRPHIVITDINMPLLDGIQLAQQMKQLAPETHIIFLTGYDYFDYAVSALKIGVEDYVMKPITKKDVEEMLTKVVKKVQSEQQAKKLQALLKDSATIEVTDELATTPLATLIQQQLADPQLSLKSLAQQLNFTPAYLSTLIKAELGITFQDYVIQERMTRAKVLLLTTDLKIYEIAQAVGFEDVNYFSIRFKQVVGMSPKKYKTEVNE